MLIGYARVSTDGQNLHLQHDALGGAGCERIFEDRRSGARTDRLGLAAGLDVVRRGDMLVVWRLDQLGQFLKDLIELAERLDAAGVGLRSLHDAIDTGSSGGWLVLHMFGALVEFERDLLRERVRSGLAAARARGKALGRKPRQRPKSDRLACKVLALGAAGRSYRPIGRELGLSKNAVAEIVKRDREAKGRDASEMPG
ncbi:recombinase family protein (plasmid) [Azospirillum sp. A26]|uniref:recombinase family protein n=1 Tax=Azospirillum sp. A26 TaxID=3160607 RepID=UPI003672E95C